MNRNGLWARIVASCFLFSALGACGETVVLVGTSKDGLGGGGVPDGGVSGPTANPEAPGAARSYCAVEGCGADVGPGTGLRTWCKDIRPRMVDTCDRCHGSEEGRGGWSSLSYDQARLTARGAPAFSPCCELGPLLEAVRAQDGAVHHRTYPMRPGDQRVVESWVVEDGAPRGVSCAP